jgi:hypothetical protein
MIQNTIPVADEACITPAETAAEGGEDSVLRSSAQPRGMRLSDARLSSSTSRITATKEVSTRDIYVLPGSPQPAPAATRNTTHKNFQEYSLEGSPFHAVSSGKDVDTDSAPSPAQHTRSKLQITNLSKRKSSLLQVNRPERIMRNLPSRRAITDLVGDESLQAPAEKRYGLRNQEIGSKLLLTSAYLPQEVLLVDSKNIGYPTPEKSSRPRETRAMSARQGATAPAQKEHTASEQARESLREAADQQNQDGVEENEVEGDEEGLGDDSSADDQTVTHESEGSYLNAATNNKQPPVPSRKRDVKKVTELHGCSDHWAQVWKSAQEIRDFSTAPTDQIRELTRAMKDFKRKIRQPSSMTPEDQEEEGEEEEDDEDSLSGLEKSDLSNITGAIEKLKDDLSSLRDARQEKLRQDISRQVIPRAVFFSRKVLSMRAANGRLSMSALKELCKMLTATQVLCKAMLNLKSAVAGENDKPRSKSGLKPLLKGIRLSLTRIEQSLRTIEKKYRAAISDLRAEKHNALAKIRQQEADDKHAREQEEQRMKRLASRQNRVDYVRQGMAGRQQQIPMHPGPHVREHSPRRTEELEEWDVDDLDLLEPLPPPTYSFNREPTEDIPGPPKRVWQIEETLALSFLLLHYRDADRYERIQEKISKFSRSIRQAGGEKILSMSEDEIVKIDLAGDKLDELGNMDVGEIEEHARYLKAMQVGGLDMPLKTGGMRDSWASLVDV